MKTNRCCRSLCDRLALCCAACLLSFYSGTALLAQPNEAPRELRRAIEEIIVTARRVEESLQETTVSITAFSRDDLVEIGFSEVRDIASYTPNLDIRPSVGGYDEITLSMRGMFVSDFQIGFDPPVGVYVDGSYIARNVGMIFDIVDVERIEVLRGPQGTLFGRNTIGGAINIVTTKPRGEFAFEQQVTLGNHGRERYRTMIDTSSLGNLSARLTFLKTAFDGTVKSLYSDRDLGDRDAVAGRLAAQWVGTAFSAHYAYDLSRSERRNNLGQVTHARPLFADPNGEFYGGGYYDEMRRVASTNRQSRVPVVGAKPTETDIDGHSLTLEWELSPQRHFKSISNFREMEIGRTLEFVTLPAPDDGSLCSSPNPGDYDFVTGTCFNPVPAGLLVPALSGSSKVDQRQWSQEFQLIGSAVDERLQYITGLYYFEEQATDASRGRGTLVISAPFVATLLADALGVPQEAVVPQNRGNSLLIRSDASVTPSSTSTDNKAYATYGDFTYTVLPRLETTLGFRYTVDERTSIRRAAIEGAFRRVVASDRWSKFNPSLTVRYSWTDDINTYVKVATGYRAGGFNQRVATVADFKQSFDEENVISYELGWKTEWRDHSLRFNGALFYADYTDLQLITVSPTAGSIFTDIVNAGTSIHSGLEIDAVWKPTANLMFTAAYGYLNVDIKEFLDQRRDPVTSLLTNPGVTEDVSDNVEPSFAPENTGALAVEYLLNPRPWGQLSFRVDGTYRSEAQAANPQLFLYEKLNAHALLNARATWSQIPVAGDGRLSVALWGRNLTNKEHHMMALDLGILGYAFHTWAELRSYGVDLVYEFGR